MGKDNLIYILILLTKTNLTELETQELVNSIIQLDQEQKLYSLISEANRQRIIPIAYSNLKSISSTINNSSIKNLLIGLKKKKIQITQFNMLLAIELTRITSILEKNSIPVISFKGVSLAILAYQNINMRQFGDIDILVAPEYWHKAYYILEKNGYKDILNLSSYQKKIWNQKAKEINLFNSKKSIHIDLQRYIFDNDYPLKFNYNLFNNTTYIKINKQQIRTFNTEALLIYLTIHGSKHLFERISWIKDIDMLIRNQQIDWILVNKQLETIKDFRRMFLLGIYLSYIYYQTPIPKNYIEMFHENKWLFSLEDFIQSNWQDKRNFIYHTYASLKLFPSIFQKTSYISKVVFKPSKNEYRLIQLPDSIHFLYYPLRIFSLIKKYLFSF